MEELNSELGDQMVGLGVRVFPSPPGRCRLDPTSLAAPGRPVDVTPEEDTRAQSRVSCHLLLTRSVYMVTRGF